MPRFIDLTGRRFGCLIVLRRSRNVGNKENKIGWYCHCSCGSDTVVAGDALRSGTTRSCGHLRSESNTGRNRAKDLMGQSFGYLQVIERAPTVKNHARWKCRCICGDAAIVDGRHLTDGTTKSCGCKHFGVGVDNANWRGDTVKYEAFHKRVEVARGRPKQCEICGTTSLIVRYDWANLTGHYEDINDYKRMCRSCHCRYDEIQQVDSPARNRGRAHLEKRQQEKSSNV